MGGTLNAGKHSIRALIAQLMPGQLWGLLGSICGVLVGAFALGVFVQTTKTDRDLLKRDSNIVRLEEDLRKRNEEIRHKKARLDSAELQLRLLNTKTRFQQQYLTYLQGRGSDRELAKKLFVDLICGMWRKDQEQRIAVEQEPLGLTMQDLSHGASPELSEFLRRQIPDVQIHKLNRGHYPEVMRDLKQEPALIEEIDRRLTSTKLFKIVKFSNDESYVLPNEIAAAVHNRPDCAP